MQIKAAHVILGIGAVLIGYELFKKKGSGPGGQLLAGDKVQVGDEVHVPITSLPAPVPGLPQGAGLVDIKVTGVTADTVSGMVVAYIVHELPTPQIIPLPLPIGPIQIARSLITGVVRGGVAVS